MGAMRKKRTLPRSFTGTTQMPDAPPLPVAPHAKSVPPAKGSPVAPPPMWNYEAKDAPPKKSMTPEARAPKGAKLRTGDVEKAAKDAKAEAPPAPAVDPAKAAEEAEDLEALRETSAAIAELNEEMARLGMLVDLLPE